MRVKITKRVVDALVPDDTVSDTEVKGFVARRLPSGTVTYGYRYRDRGSRQRWLPLGLHGSITPDQARELAKQRAGEVASGHDPALEHAEGRAAAARTVDALRDDFWSDMYAASSAAPMRSSAPSKSMCVLASAANRSTT